MKIKPVLFLEPSTIHVDTHLKNLVQKENENCYSGRGGKLTQLSDDT